MSALVRTVAPAASLMTLDDAKLHCRIDTTSDDPLVQALIDAATGAIEGYLQRALLTQTWRYSFDHWPLRRQPNQYPTSNDAAFYERPWSYIIEPVRLPRPPLQSVSTFTYTDINGNVTTVDAAIYSVNTDNLPGEIALKYNQSWPSTAIVRNGIQVVYKAGYGDTPDKVPAEIIAAAKLLIGHYYAFRESHILASQVADNPAVAALLAQHVYREAPQPF